MSAAAARKALKGKVSTPAGLSRLSLGLGGGSLSDDEAGRLPTTGKCWREGGETQRTLRKEEIPMPRRDPRTLEELPPL